MGDRLPFDPNSMAQRPAPLRTDLPLTVSQLAARISDAVAAEFAGKVRIVGEVSGFRERTHWYFDLKDSTAVVSCVMFAGAARRAAPPANGMQVVVSGRVEFYEKQGRISLLAESIEPVGAGAQDLALRALIEELRKLGWLDESRKRPLPAFPRRIGVVTSRSGAALQDVVDTMRRRCPAVGVAFVDARVQGEGAAAEVAGAIRWLGARGNTLEIDAILVTRGGGSKEDLAAFNDRTVAEAIVNCPIPVVAAIGHETDTTVAELVADLRCATPTQAAMRLSPDRHALTEQLDAASNRLRTVVVRDLREAKQRCEAAMRLLRQAGSARARAAAVRLERMAAKLESHKPAAVHARRAATLESARVRLIAALKARLAEVDLKSVESRLIRGGESCLRASSVRVEGLSKRLTSVGPASVLNRGFSYTVREDGRLVRSVADARPGERIRTTVSDGVLRSVVEGDAAPQAKALDPLRKNQKPDPRRDQMDLFGGSR